MPALFPYPAVDGEFGRRRQADYTYTSGSGTIAGGQRFSIGVPILGDANEESDETFSLKVLNVRYA